MVAISVRDAECPKCGAKPRDPCRWQNGAYKGACSERKAIMRERKIDRRKRDG